MRCTELARLVRVARPSEPPKPDAEVLDGLRAMGIPEETIDRAVERGDPEGAIFDAVVLPAIADRTVSLVEIEERGGLRVSDAQAFVAAFGLPAPEPNEP